MHNIGLADLPIDSVDHLAGEAGQMHCIPSPRNPDLPRLHDFTVAGKALAAGQELVTGGEEPAGCRDDRGLRLTGEDLREGFGIER